jgi:NAD(P)-dependent dehydrogenase (short-subunit alcohol dehydrogenase family)
MSGTAVIAGVGPGFCEEFAWRLAREGHPVGLFGRSADYLAEFEEELREAGHEALAVPTDVTDPGAVAAGFDRVRDALGRVEVLAHTASTVTTPGGTALDPDRFEEMWRLYAYGGLLCAREAIEDAAESGGTILFFGAAPESGDVAFKSGKDATRGLARALADEYGSRGVHVAHVVIDGGLLNPDVYEGSGEVEEDRYIDPAAAAETCYHLVEQPDRGRTFELDLHATDRTAPR